MAQDSDAGGNGGLYFIVGGLVVAAIGIGVYLYNDGQFPGSRTTTTIERTVTPGGNSTTTTTTRENR